MTNHYISRGTNKAKRLFVFVFLSGFFTFFQIAGKAQVSFEKEVEISDKGLFFDGEDVDPSTPNRGPKYDFVFGNRITPHGDCIKEYNGYIFMTWYRGGKNDRHVMLSRYNPNTGVIKTIEFGHQHNGFQNQPHLGESHNTIAVGICPIDGTIHMLYDMHSYSENRPSNGSLANDYFRYSYSKKNAATVSDSQFTLSQFVKDGDGDYKHLKMRNGTNYKSLTYPNFFLNKQGELFMWIREGGNTNGAYKFCKYDGTKWSDFTQFNVLNAKNKPGVDHNWGLYGDIKFESGKMRIGFLQRSNNKNDEYELNNGFHYAYSDDPNGLTQWKDHKGKGFSLPLFDPSKVKVSEPGDVLGVTGKNSVKITSGADWTVTERGDIHMVTTVGTGSARKNVHTYRKASANSFTTSTNFPGGNLYTYNNEVFLIGLNGGRVFVEKANGGTNSWTKIYQATSGKKFRHGNVYISDEGKLYFYLMEQKTGSAQPIYLQIIDLGLDQNVNQAPSVIITSPSNNASFELGEEIQLGATSTDTDGSVVKINFKIDDAFYKQVTSAPYKHTFTPTTAGTYKVAARAFDNENAQTEVFVLISVTAPNVAPEIEITEPSDNAIYQVGEAIPLAATASDPDGMVTKVNFKLNNAFYKLDNSAPFENSFVPSEPGTYIVGARAFDDDGGATEKTVTVFVEVVLSSIGELQEENNGVYPNPSQSGVFNLSVAKEYEVYSLHGELVGVGNGAQIDLSKQPRGIYFLHFNQDVVRLIK